MSITVFTLIIVLYMLMGNEYYCIYSNYCPIYIYSDGQMSITVFTLIIALYADGI